MARALTVEQASEFLQVSPYTVRKWLRTGKIPGRKIGRVYRILDTDLEAMLGAETPQAEMVREPRNLVGYGSLAHVEGLSTEAYIAGKREAVSPPAGKHPIRGLLASKRKEILRIAHSHGASNVRVFGSVVRGEADEDSDVDFLVEFVPGTSLLQHGALIAELEDLLGRKVDVAPEKTLKERIRDRVLAEAIPL